MKRVLIITETGDVFPSGRIRALIYKDLLAAEGIEAHYESRLIPRITRWLHPQNLLADRIMRAGPGRALSSLNNTFAIAREERIIRQSHRYDVIYLQKVASWRLVSALRHGTKARLVYDLNDGIWLPSRSYFAKGMVREILNTVDAVTCDNPYGLEFASHYNSSLFLVPDPPQIEVFDQYRQKVMRTDTNVVLGWIGSPNTLFNLYSILEPLESLFERFENVTLRLVGVGYEKRLLPRFEKVRYTSVPFYSQEEMISEVLQMDIGLFPLFDLEDSHARGILKSTIYMAGEACLVTCPIGQNRDLIEDGKNGMLAQSRDEWLEKLTLLVTNIDLRRKMILAGLQTVRNGFTLRQCYEKLSDALFGG